ncbi:MAG: YggS family pyridoxal phosphate-dependent enzyme [Candidatus Zixiibacteriota bacterium]
MARLEIVAKNAGRNPAEITVVAVSKTRPIEDILTAILAGMSNIGESKLQEAQAKLSGMQRDFVLHMIGHLQTNKVKAAIDLFDIIDSVDTIKLARLINEEAQKQQKNVPILLEINCSREEQKYGLAPEETLEVAAEVAQMKNLDLRGLMTVAPFVEDESLVRAAFSELRELFGSIKTAIPGMREFKQLSMGMSDDWELAVAEGSTMIRIGRALFGER